MRNAAALLALFFSVYVPAALGQSLAHELYVHSLDCQSDVARYPHSEKEMRTVHVEWLSKTDLKVSFWQLENTDMTVRRSDSTVVVRDSTLALSLETDRAPPQTGGLFVACGWPAWVTFIIHGASRGPFEIEILGRRVPAADIVGG